MTSPANKPDVNPEANNDENADWRSWYRDFDQNYSPEKRRQWYSDAAEAYRWARPRYPDALIDATLKQAGLAAGDSVLEIGCGPGIATQAFAQRALVMQGVEPSPRACELAREACCDYADVSIANSTFEDFSLLAGKQYDAVLAATSFHWVSPDVACQKSAAALKPGGSLILLWATPPQPSKALAAQLQPVYQRHGLADNIQYHQREQSYYRANFEQFGNIVSESGWFEPAPVQMETHHSQYSVEKYLALLSTLSDYIALPEETRRSLLMDLGTVLKATTGEAKLPLIHWFAAQISPLRGRL
jgi:SAM-dependent methyltransferase